jgi:Rha family phage regulatory protein
MNTDLSTRINSAVAIDHGIPKTTSLEVARIFGRQHKNVLRDIENILPQVPDVFGKLNFEPTSYAVQQPNGGTANRKMYTLTKDAFTLLVMGYTGKEAMAFKVAYIRRFNEMELALRTAGTLTREEIAELRQEISELRAKIAQFETDQINRLPVLVMDYIEGPVHFVRVNGLPYVVADHVARLLRDVELYRDRSFLGDTAREVLVRSGCAADALKMYRLRVFMDAYNVAGGTVCKAFGVSTAYRSILLVPVTELACLAETWPQLWQWLWMDVLPKLHPTPGLRLVGGAK